MHAIALIEYKARYNWLYSFEKFVFKNRFRHFSTLEEGVSWIQTTV